MKRAAASFCSRRQILLKIVMAMSLPMIAGCTAKSETPSTGTGSSGSETLSLAFVINGPSDFWKFARAGIRKAEKEFNVDVDFQVPGDGTAAKQSQIIRTLITKGVQGMAVSVLDPKGAIGILNEAAERMPVVTQDSDCPESNRVAYIGTDNVAAGRLAGKEILKAIPDGGKVALFVGKLDVANAQERRQGILEVIAGSKVSVVETFTDETDRARAQRNVRNALDKYQDLKCLVGLWAYNAPAIVKVVKEKNLQDKVKIVAFDEVEQTLDAIEEGTIQSTVVQQPFEFGYQSIRALSLLARKQDPELPEDGLKYIPAKVIDKSNIAPFRVKVKEMLAEGE